MNRNLDNLKKPFVWVAMVALGCQIFIGNIQHVLAFNAGVVVINEIGWAGTPDEGNDEWIELFNTSRDSVNLSGWSIDDDNGSSIYTIDSGEIAPYGYFLIADSAQALSSARIDKVIGLSLANSGDSLILKDNAGIVIDTVNGSGGAWYAGNATSKASMERIDPSNKSDVAGNWATSTSGNGAKGRSGTAVIGTPGSANSVFAGASTKVSLQVDGEDFQTGNTITVTSNISDVDELFAYGFKINYDPTVIEFVSAQEGAFLKNGAETIFDYALENGTEGNLVIAGSRVTNTTSGASGSGELFSLDFEVVGAAGKKTGLNFVLGESFISDVSGDVPAGFEGEEITVGTVVAVSAVGSPKIELGDGRYTLELSWTLPAGGADKYLVKRKDTKGNFILIGETAYLSFIDSDSVTGGGKLIPNRDYEYQIIPVKNEINGPLVTVTARETRGLKADMNRDDKVNGRDLEKLARLYGLKIGDTGFDPLADTNFDGIIDGSDLIDIGVDFGKTYTAV